MFSNMLLNGHGKIDSLVDGHG